MAFTKLAGGMTKAQNKVTFTDKNGNKRVFIAKPRKSKYATTRLMVKALREKGLSDKFIAQAVMKREKCKKEVALKLIEGKRRRIGPPPRNRTAHLLRRDVWSSA